jgi:hypothetical protein
MADCEKLPTCIFFNDQMDEMPTVAHLMKQQYCRGNFAACARYRVAEALGGSKVPRDLFPNDAKRADRLLLARV